MIPRDYDLFAKLKEPLQGTGYSTGENIRIVGRSLLGITEVDALMVYDAFHKSGRRGKQWGGGGGARLY
jgi:hypothetical protein